MPKAIRTIREVVVVDIDGTLSDASERARKYLSGIEPDWDGFYLACGQDAPIKDVIAVVEVLTTGFDIVLCSGRRESCRETTAAWLEEFAPGIQYCDMLLREDGDTRHDTEVKPELLDRYIQGCGQDTRVVAILEDRDSMVKKWRELGYTCLQVAEGNF